MWGFDHNWWEGERERTEVFKGSRESEPQGWGFSLYRDWSGWVAR